MVTNQAKVRKDMFFGATPKIFDHAFHLRQRLTPAEQKLWDCISNKQLGVKFRRQHPLNMFIADFYCHQLKLVIEIDGVIHNQTERREYDIGRTGELDRFGIKVIRFGNADVLNNTENVVRQILEAINDAKSKLPSPPPTPDPERGT